MKSVIRALKKEEKKLEKHIKYLRYMIFECNPLDEILKLRIKAQEIFKQNLPIEDEIIKIKSLAEQEKKLISLEKRRQNIDRSGKGIEKLVRLEHELADIKRELFLKRK